jgi:hypothetical protein
MDNININPEVRVERELRNVRETLQEINLKTQDRSRSKDKNGTVNVCALYEYLGR